MASPTTIPIVAFWFNIFIKQMKQKANTNSTRSPGTTSVCFSVVTVNDEYRKPEFKIKRRR